MRGSWVGQSGCGKCRIAVLELVAYTTFLWQPGEIRPVTKWDFPPS